MAWPTCDVCGKEAKGVASSSLGAISYAYCYDCLMQHAEPLGMWTATIWACGGPDNIRSDLITLACSWQDGAYIGWDEIVAAYNATEFEEDIP